MHFTDKDEGCSKVGVGISRGLKLCAAGSVCVDKNFCRGALVGVQLCEILGLVQCSPAEYRGLRDWKQDPLLSRYSCVR